ncbi:hypothetical protein OESDEN_06053 [Oesophagostomum dentatum]|uniref:Carbohydrate kinase FGGY C-terminal domain-containing protein n=1 Tax=Oesophagostomum dentatum TaxID=61180 RepID=A0A0B1TDW5_OESDE|nr:hypothetical protein OESDEN_06053 [Oesophagostomum dentatum]
MEPICRSVKSTEGVIFVPSFNGLFTPYWDPSARGTILGLTQYTTKAHICLAALQAVAYQSAEMIEAVELDLQDTTIKTIKTPNTTECSGWGAAVAGGIGAQQFSLDEYSTREASGNCYMPHSDTKRRAAGLSKWKEAVSRARGWAE